MSEETVSYRRFSRLKAEIKNRVDDLNQTQKSFIKLIFLSEPCLKDSDEVKNDSKSIDDTIDSCYDILDELGERKEIQEGLSGSKPESEPIDLASILNDTITKLSVQQDQNLTKLATQLATRQDDKISHLVNSLSTKQDENTEKLVKSNSSSAPKPVQPFFTSKENDSDYSNYRDFWTRFFFFYQES